MEREDWGSLAAFAVAADERSFTRAAAGLGVSASAFSHSMRRLEERLRIQLLARSTPRFTRSYPDVVVECLINPALTNIVAQRFDAGIRLGESLEKDVVAVPVTGQLRMAVVGSPQYFASHPAPSTPHDLRMHRCINFRLPSFGTLYKWEFEKGHHGVEVAVQGPLIFDDEGLVIDAALAGVGLACLIEDQVASLLQAGTLSRVLED
jgi:DNA-binding transcriptional LysR family regulator